MTQQQIGGKKALSRNELEGGKQTPTLGKCLWMAFFVLVTQHVILPFQGSNNSHVGKNKYLVADRKLIM